LVTAVVFLINYTLWGVEIEFFTRTVFFVFILAMALIDGQFYVIPDKLSIGGLVVGLAFSFLPGDLSPQSAFFGSVFGGCLLLGVAWLGERIFKKEAMGMGDVKMMAMIGSFIGLQGVVLTVFLGSLLGTLIFGPMNLRKRRLIPFGVFLGIGGLISIYFSDLIIRFYISTILG
jgi:leader peptidase (prepilin peptidase)/N-methyltransferase